ncbi:MAG: hypothetical protein JSV40_06935 [Deltaproteobacteria bacterium]|nr:MAG: hypothetical protein JSV40_06935 [Deltaproteobacteria bacterium]
MKGLIAAILAGGLFLAVADVSAVAKKSNSIPYPDVPRITKEELMENLADPEVIILDVRPEQQWKQTKLKIVGAIHEDPMAIESWAGNYPKDKTIVLY